MAIIGYARVSSTGQSLDVQVEQLTKAGCTKIFQEKKSGTSIAQRTELHAALEYVREGDVFVITRMDRLARSIVDLRRIVDRLTRKDVAFRVVQQSFDTTRPEGRLMMNMLAAFAEFETDIRKERQAEGIARAKLDGRYKGRKASIDPLEVARLRAEGHGASEIAKRMGIARASVYRVLKG